MTRRTAKTFERGEVQRRRPRRTFTSGGRLTRERRFLLETYVRQYNARGVVGVWTEFCQAIDSALREIDRLKRRVPSRRIRKRSVTK